MMSTGLTMLLPRPPSMDRIYQKFQFFPHCKNYCTKPNHNLQSCTPPFFYIVLSANIVLSVLPYLLLFDPFNILHMKQAVFTQILTATHSQTQPKFYANAKCIKKRETQAFYMATCTPTHPQRAATPTSHAYTSIQRI